VQGYVRSVSSKGLFLALDRAHTARIKLGQLSDGFIEDPAAAFPVGSRVEGRVLSVEHTKPQPSAAPEGATTGSSSSSSRPLEDDGVRVELSLRSAESSGQLRTLAEIQEGELSGGKVGSNTRQALCL
jgi:rRNA biogenesis protein RRP5